MAPSIRPYDIGCEPSPTVPAETLLQDGWRTYLLFHAVSKSAEKGGRLAQLGVAVVECQQCMATRFGYPNDEGLPEHPLFDLGLAKAPTSILEVVDSPWAAEVLSQRLASARRDLAASVQ